MLVFNCSQIDAATISISNEHANRHNQSVMHQRELAFRKECLGATVS